MYSQILDFAIICKNEHLERILQSVTQIEDCSYRFTVYYDICKAYEVSAKKNTAIILDGRMLSGQVGGVVKYWAEERRNGKDVPELAVILSPNQIEEKVDWYRDIDHIWLTCAEDEEETIKIYFQKLVIGMKEKADARKQGICFQTIIDSTADLVWFKDTEGRHLIVNNEFCNFVNKSKEQIYKQGHCYIWNASEEDEKVCLDSDREIMLGRETQKFEEQVYSNGKDYIIQSYKSPLIEQGEIFGTCGIGQNVTNERNLQRKLQIVLDQIPFAVALVNKDETLIYKNEMFDVLFPEGESYLGKNVNLFKKDFHFPDRVEEGETVEIEMQICGSKSCWFSYYEKKILDTFGLQTEKMLVLQDVTLKKELERQKEIIAYTDYLTGLANRRWMLKSLENDIRNLTVIMMDIDDFKSINDTFGHGIGDEVLKKFAGLLKKVFVADSIIRYGGDEFLVITRLDKKEAIKVQMDHLMQEARNIEYCDDMDSGISISCGITMGNQEMSCTIEQLIEMSDRAMYYIKKNGKHGYRFFDEI